MAVSADVRGETQWSALRCPWCGSLLLTNWVQLWCSYVGDPGALMCGQDTSCDYGLRDRVTYNSYPQSERGRTRPARTVQYRGGKLHA